ncbi:MAG TPA: hypothetical protein VK420_14350 [Longimicrobium sp.]|jgi:hypothetical protein|nr:hypothetical protein [Longimicrobium sp.]
MKRADARVFRGVGALLVAGGVALLMLVVSALRSGTLDARPKHRSRADPEWIVAAQEPFWFYGIIVLIAGLAAYALVQGSRMIRETRSQR